MVVNGWCCLAAYAAQHGDIEPARRAADEAARLATTSGQSGLIALARDVDGFVAAYSGDHGRSFAANLDGLRDARKAGDTYDAINLLTHSAFDLLYLDRFGEALAFADEAFDLTGTFEVGPLLGTVFLARGSALVAAGRHAAGRASLVEGLRIARDRFPDPLVTADLLFTVGACESSFPTRFTPPGASVPLRRVCRATHVLSRPVGHPHSQAARRVPRPGRCTRLLVPIGLGGIGPQARCGPAAGQRG